MREGGGSCTRPNRNTPYPSYGMYPVPLGVNFLVSHKVSGTGQFTGADYGRARATVTNVDTNAVVRVASKLYGTPSNALTVEFVDRGAGNAVSSTYVEQIGSAIRVILRRGSSGAPLATSAEVAAAINGFVATPGGPAGPIGAVANGTGLGVVSAAAPVSLAGGVAPGSVGPYAFRWAANNTNMGLLHVEQESSVIIRQMDAAFTVPSGTRTLTISRAPLNEAFEPDLTEAVPLLEYGDLTNATPNLSASDMNWLLPPCWALVVTTSVALAGLVRFDLRRDL